MSFDISYNCGDKELLSTSLGYRHWTILENITGNTIWYEAIDGEIGQNCAHIIKHWRKALKTVSNNVIPKGDTRVVDKRFKLLLECIDECPNGEVSITL